MTRTTTNGDMRMPDEADRCSESATMRAARGAACAAAGLLVTLRTSRGDIIIAEPCNPPPIDTAPLVAVRATASGALASASQSHRSSASRRGHDP